jgi:hypothetical protein
MPFSFNKNVLTTCAHSFRQYNFLNSFTCYVHNQITNYCSTCGHSLTKEAEQIVQDAEGQIQQLLIQNPQVQMAFLQILNTLKKQPA